MLLILCNNNNNHNHNDNIKINFHGEVGNIYDFFLAIDQLNAQILVL